MYMLINEYDVTMDTKAIVRMIELSIGLPCSRLLGNIADRDAQIRTAISQTMDSTFGMDAKEVLIIIFKFFFEKVESKIFPAVQKGHMDRGKHQYWHLFQLLTFHLLTYLF